MSTEIQVVKDRAVFAPTQEDYKEMAIGEPQNMFEARALAEYLSRSKLLSPALRGDIPTTMALLVSCKQYGLPITALNEAQEINGRVGFWGRTKLGIVTKSPVCEYIMPVEVTDKKAVVAAKRKGWPKEVLVEYTIEQAEKAGLVARSDAWKKHPADMLLWKAESRAMSRVFPDVCQGMAVVEDADEERPQVSAVALPQEVEMPKQKRTRRVKAVAEESSVVTEEEKADSPILPPAEAMEQYDVQPNFKAAPVVVGEGETVDAEKEYNAGMEEFIAGKKTAPFEKPKRLVRFVKQVLLENGERYIVAKNPLIDEEEKYKIPTAGMASELKKMTGMKAFLFVMEGKVVNYDPYPEN